MRARFGQRLAGCGAGRSALSRRQSSRRCRRAPRAPKVTLVADHLDNPRGVSIGTGGRVLVAEAGNGDPNGGRCAGVIDPESGVKSTMCLGFTGAVIAVQGTKVTRVLSNLPSAAAPSGFESSGPAFAVDVTGGKVAVIMQGVTNQPPASWKPWATTTFDHVLLQLDAAAVARSRCVREGARPRARRCGIRSVLGNHEWQRRAAGVVVDAVERRAALEERRAEHARGVPPEREPMPGGGTTMQQAVPTSVVALPDGSYLVGELTGFPYVPGSARIWRVVPGHAPTVWKTGFTNIVGLARGADGSIYVSEITSHGLLQSNPSGGLFRVAPNGTKTQIAVAGLKYAGGVAVAADGSIYIANCSVGLPNSTSPCRGQLLEVVQ